MGIRIQVILISKKLVENQTKQRKNMKRIVYEIFNHETKETSFVTEEELENLYSELKAGIIEIIEEYEGE